MGTEACDSCGGTGSERIRSLKISRGENSVVVDSRYWSCAYPAPEGAEPVVVEWVDADQARAAELAAAAAWVEKYGEPMPAAKRPGRKPAEPKEEKVLLLLSAAELGRLDAACGDLSRNDFIRQAIQEKLGRLAA